MQHDAFRRHAKRRGEMAAVVGAHQVTVHDALRHAGSAARIDDVKQVFLLHLGIVGRFTRKAGDKCRVTAGFTFASADQNVVFGFYIADLVTIRAQFVQ